MNITTTLTNTLLEIIVSGRVDVQCISQVTAKVSEKTEMCKQYNNVVDRLVYHGVKPAAILNAINDATVKTFTVVDLPFVIEPYNKSKHGSPSNYVLWLLNINGFAISIEQLPQYKPEHVAPAQILSTLATCGLLLKEVNFVRLACKLSKVSPKFVANEYFN